MVRVVILTALEQKERQIALGYLKDVEPVRHPETGTDYYKGNFEGFEIYLGRTDQTNVYSAIETERAIAFIKPDFIFFVGVAGGLKDVNLGDIVIGQDVFGYERGKSVKENEVELFKPRSKFGMSSYKLERLATNFSVSDNWEAIKVRLENEEVAVFTGTIASGEQVNASKTSELSAFLKQNCSHALAIEMEGLGFLETCSHYPDIPSLLLRGISDLIDDKGDSDKKGFQEQAMKNVSAFLFGLLNHSKVDLRNYTGDKGRQVSIYDKLSEIMCKLYPEGVKMNRVWQRAGGDISLITLNTNAYTQWLDALELLENGGGGDITVSSLLAVLKKDFPSNQYVQGI